VHGQGLTAHPPRFSHSRRSADRARAVMDDVHVADLRGGPVDARCACCRSARRSGRRAMCMLQVCEVVRSTCYVHVAGLRGGPVDARCACCRSARRPGRRTMCMLQSRGSARIDGRVAVAGLRGDEVDARCACRKVAVCTLQPTEAARSTHSMHAAAATTAPGQRAMCMLRHRGGARLMHNVHVAGLRGRAVNAQCAPCGAAETAR
jgi:hypothetical protein